MPNVIILLLLWSWILCKSWATSCEFLVMKVLGRLNRFSNFLFSNLAVLYEGTNKQSTPSILDLKAGYTSDMYSSYI